MKTPQLRHSHYADRTHFLATTGQAMRYVLADRARRQVAAKRGGSWAQVILENILVPDLTLDLFALDQALSRLKNAAHQCTKGNPSPLGRFIVRVCERER